MPCTRASPRPALDGRPRRTLRPRRHDGRRMLRMSLARAPGPPPGMTACPESCQHVARPTSSCSRWTSCTAILRVQAGQPPPTVRPRIATGVRAGAVSRRGGGRPSWRSCATTPQRTRSCIVSLFRRRTTAPSRGARAHSTCTTHLPRRLAVTRGSMPPSSAPFSTAMHAHPAAPRQKPDVVVKKPDVVVDMLTC